jgi:hypothetical protein
LLENIQQIRILRDGGGGSPKEYVRLWEGGEGGLGIMGEGVLLKILKGCLKGND